MPLFFFTNGENSYIIFRLMKSAKWRITHGFE